MLRFLDGLAIDMIDLVSDFVVAPALGRPGERVIISVKLQARQRVAEPRRRDLGDQLRHMWRRRRGVLVALVDHHPAREGEHGFGTLVASSRAYIDRAVLAVGILLEA